MGGDGRKEREEFFFSKEGVVFGFFESKEKEERDLLLGVKDPRVSKTNFWFFLFHLCSPQLAFQGVLYLNGFSLINVHFMHDIFITYLDVPCMIITFILY